MGIAFTVREKMDEIGGKEDNWKKIVDEIHEMLHVDPQKRNKASDVVAAVQ